MTLLGRATQVGSLVFGNALFMCAYRGWAVFPLVLSCVVLALLESEAKLKHSDRSLAALQGTNPFPCLPDPLWRVFAAQCTEGHGKNPVLESKATVARLMVNTVAQGPLPQLIPVLGGDQREDTRLPALAKVTDEPARDR